MRLACIPINPVLIIFNRLQNELNMFNAGIENKQGGQFYQKTQCKLGSCEEINWIRIFNSDRLAKHQKFLNCLCFL